MNYEHLKTFIEVANRKSFSGAAKQLFLSQPTVTSHIKALELSLQTELFIRTRQSVKLTDAGIVLKDYAQQIVDLTTKTQNEIKKLTDDIHGTLALASSLTIGESVLPGFLYEFKERYPRVTLQTEIINSTHIVDMVKNDELELGLIEADFHDPSLNIEPFMTDELVLFSHVDYLPDNKTRLSFEDVYTLPLILREKGSGTRTVAENYLFSHKKRPIDLNIVLELGSTESVKAAVEAKLGASILSRKAIRKEVQLGMFAQIPLQDAEFKRFFHVVYKKDKTLSLISEKFIELLFEYGKEWEFISPKKEL